MKDDGCDEYSSEICKTPPYIIFDPKNLGPKNFFGPTNFWNQKNFVDRKKFLDQENFLSPKFFGPTILLGTTFFAPKIFVNAKNSYPRKFLLFTPKKLTKNVFNLKRMFSPPKVV